MNTPLTQRNSSHHVHAKTVGRVRVRSLAARGLAVVLIALAASLALPLQAQAQTPTVTISADKTSAVFKEDDITYTLMRTGPFDTALPVTVRLMQTEDFLAATELTNKTVTINAGRSTATFTVAASSFQHFAAGTKVAGGTLEAAVQDGEHYDLGMTSSVDVDIVIGVMIGFEMAAYSVGEATGPVKVKVIAHTGPRAGQPTSDATYNILPADGSATNGSDFFFVSISASILVSNFSQSGEVWQAEHGYDVTITNDEDAEDDETFDLRIERVQSTATYSLVDLSGNSCGSVCTATVTIIDDDTATPGVTVSTTALTVTEQDTTGGSYTVVLDSAPTATVTVTVAGHAGTDVTRTPGTLTFTTSNWDTVQTVTVTAGDDADTTDDSVTLTHSAASTDTGYSGITIAGVVVTVRDNDTAQVTGVTVDAGDAQLVVTWTAVDTATGYTVQWMSGGEDYNTGDRQATVTSGSTTHYTIPSLTNGTEYTVRVIATRTGVTDGPPSEEMTGTPRVPPPPPVTDLAQVMGVGVAPGNAQLVVTWTAVDTATGYTVQWMSGGEDYNTGDRQATVTSGSTTHYTIPSLTNGTEYTVRVIATRTGVTDGPPSAEVTGTPEMIPMPSPTLPEIALLLLAMLLLGSGVYLLRGRQLGGLTHA